MRPLEPLQDRRGAVLAAVVNDDDLKSPGDALERARLPPHRLLQVGFLVVGGHHRADVHGWRDRVHGAKPTRTNTVATPARLNRLHAGSCSRSPVSGCALGSTIASGCDWASTSCQPEAR